MSKPVMLNGKKVIDYQLEYDYVNAPDDYCGYFVSGTYEDGTELTEEELEALSEQEEDILCEKAIDHMVCRADF